jgi:hypothetical protein
VHRSCCVGCARGSCLVRTTVRRSCFGLCSAAAVASHRTASHRTASHRTVRRMQFVLQAEIASLSTSCSLNLAQCELKRGNAPAVVAHCTAVLEADKLCTKAWFRRAHAYLKLSELDLALADCTQALALETGRPYSSLCASHLPTSATAETQRRMLHAVVPWGSVPAHSGETRGP